ncbi:MAG: hypothetical protein ACLR0U_33620 [Enterocloster clostridioformis]
MPRFRKLNSKWKHWCHGGPFDLPLDFKGTKKTAAFIGSIQDGLPWNR